jgi:hypothetical protein
MSYETLFDPNGDAPRSLPFSVTGLTGGLLRAEKLSSFPLVASDRG